MTNTLNRWFPGASSDREQRVAIGLAGGLSVAMVAAATLSWAVRGANPQGSLLAAGAVATAASLGFTRLGRPRWTMASTIAACYLPVIGVVWTGYGPLAPAAMGQPLLIVFGCATAGRRGALFTLALAAAQTVALLAADAAGVTFRAPDERFPVLVQLTLLVVTVAIAVVLDVYDQSRRRAAERAAAAYDALAVAHANAQQARDDAMRASAAKSAFLANMSHELRTPLNAIIGYAEMLEEVVDGEGRADARQIRLAGRHLLNVVNDVLDMSRIEADRLVLHPEDVDVAELITELHERVAPAAAQRGNRVVVRAPTGPTRLRVDRLRLSQVLTNLLSNAIKFTDRGRVEIRLSRAGDAWRIEVEDTGRGMDPALLARCFQPFEQADGAGAGRDQGGTGLGLAISHRLVQAMGGTLTATSAVGVGSCFVVELPTSR